MEACFSLTHIEYVRVTVSRLFIWKKTYFPACVRAEKPLDSWWNTPPDTVQRRFRLWGSSTWHSGAFDKWGQLPQTAPGPGQDTAHGWGQRSGLYCPLSLTHAHCSALPPHWWAQPCVCVCVCGAVNPPLWGCSDACYGAILPSPGNVQSLSEIA